MGDVFFQADRAALRRTGGLGHLAATLAGLQALHLDRTDYSRRPRSKRYAPRNPSGLAPYLGGYARPSKLAEDAAALALSPRTLRRHERELRRRGCLESQIHGPHGRAPRFPHAERALARSKRARCTTTAPTSAQAPQTRAPSQGPARAPIRRQGRDWAAEGMPARPSPQLVELARRHVDHEEREGAKPRNREAVAYTQARKWANGRDAATLDQAQRLAAIASVPRTGLVLPPDPHVAAEVERRRIEASRLAAEDAWLAGLDTAERQRLDADLRRRFGAKLASRNPLVLEEVRAHLRHVARQRLDSS